MKTLAFRRSCRGAGYCRAGRLAAFAGLLIATLPAGAEDYDRGRRLYENHCQACHSSLLHSPTKTRIASFEDLRERVASWSVHAAKDWSAHEIDDVSYYLDRTFYHFGVRAE